MRKLRKTTRNRIITITSIVAFLMFGSLTTTAIGSFAAGEGDDNPPIVEENSGEVQDPNATATPTPEGNETDDVISATPTPTSKPDVTEGPAVDDPYSDNYSTDKPGYEKVGTAQLEDGVWILNGYNGDRIVLEAYEEGGDKFFDPYTENSYVKFSSEVSKLEFGITDGGLGIFLSHGLRQYYEIIKVQKNTTPSYVPPAPTETPMVFYEKDEPGEKGPETETPNSGQEVTNEDVPLSDASEPVTPEDNTTTVVEDKEEKVPMAAAPTDATPETGDSMNPVMPAVGMGSSVLAILGILIIRKKRRI